MHMIKTWNFDFAGMMVASVGTNFDQEQKEKQRSQHIIPREIKLIVLYQEQKIGCQLSKKEILVMGEQIIDT